MEYIRRWFWEREFRGWFNSDTTIEQGLDLFIFQYDKDNKCYRMSIDYHEKRYIKVIHDNLRGNGVLDAVDIAMSILRERHAKWKNSLK